MTNNRLLFSFALVACLLVSASLVAAQESKYAKLGATKIHYQSYGKGKEALVLVHCWTCNMELWREHIPEFAKRARVIVLDLPGHGLSDKPKINYSMDLFTSAIDAVLQDAQVDRAVLVGHSMGTPVVRQFYRKYPHKTLAIVIVDGVVRPFGPKESREQFIGPLRGENYQDAGKKMLTAMIATLSETDKQRVLTSFLNTPQHVLVSAMDEMSDDALYTTDKINVPVLALLAKSPFWPPDTEQFLRSLAPDLEFEMWEGVSHFLFMDKPKEFNAAVIAFLDKKKLLK